MHIGGVHAHLAGLTEDLGEGEGSLGTGHCIAGGTAVGAGVGGLHRRDDESGRHCATASHAGHCDSTLWRKQSHMTSHSVTSHDTVPNNCSHMTIEPSECM